VCCFDIFLMKSSHSFRAISCLHLIYVPAFDTAIQILLSGL